MFTGIVEGIGRIAAALPRGEGLRIAVEVAALDRSDIRVGDSIAVAGCCLTVVERSGDQLSFDVSAETLACTARLDRPGRVNLEQALRLSDHLGGHLVSGHIDGVGVVAGFEALADGSTRLEVDAPAALARFIAAKGSIAVDGVSLTVNAVAGPRFAVNLIPHTLVVTTLGELAPGARVNLEVDVIARYVARLHQQL
jgi:riboflavin synthase